jgi:hypothetical protein
MFIFIYLEHVYNLYRPHDYIIKKIVNKNAKNNHNKDVPNIDDVPEISPNVSESENSKKEREISYINTIRYTRL